MEKEEKAEELGRTEKIVMENAKEFQSLKAHEKKKRRWKFILFLILIILGEALYISYDKGVFDKWLIEHNLIKKEAKKGETNKSSNDIATDNELKYVKYGYAEDVNIYAVYPSFIVYSVKDELYVAEDYSLSIPIVNNIFYLDDMKFKDDVAKVKYADTDEEGNTSEVSHEITITKLNIKVSDVYTIIGKHAVGFRDPTGEVFIIYKDGGLTHYFFPKHLKTEGKKVLSNYKIKDIEIKCTDDDCAKIKYKLTLQDDTIKEIDSLDKKV